MFDQYDPASGNPSQGPSPDFPQFSTAEYANVPGTERCAFCSNLIADQYFRVNGHMVCAQCAAQSREGQPHDSHAAFTQGLLLGAGAAIIGLIVYATFTIITGWYIGYLALGVGWLVAKAIKKGSGGLGGRRYQIAAVLLTYGAISLAAIPISISYFMKHSKEQKQVQTQQAEGTPADGNTQQQDQQQAQQQESHASPSFGAALLSMLALGLASPFLELQDPVHGLIGLFILFIGLRIAWQLAASAPLEVDGPYSVGARL
jgi:hypothetical protein